MDYGKKEMEIEREREDRREKEERDLDFVKVPIGLSRVHCQSLVCSHLCQHSALCCHMFHAMDRWTRKEQKTYQHQENNKDYVM